MWTNQTKKSLFAFIGSAAFIVLCGCRRPIAADTVARPAAMSWAWFEIWFKYAPTRRFYRSLHRLGHRTGTGNTWTELRVSSMRQVRGIPGHQKIADASWLTLADAAKELKVSAGVIRRLLEQKIQNPIFSPHSPSGSIGNFPRKMDDPNDFNFSFGETFSAIKTQSGMQQGIQQSSS